MAQVTFLPADRSVEVPLGSTVLEAARQAGVIIDSPCNGAVVCGKCAVRVVPEFLARVEQKGAHTLSENERERGLVLACAAEITGDLVVEVPEGQERELKITSHGESVAVALAPFIAKEYLPEVGLTQVVAGDRVIAREEGDTTGQCYGVVIDIGTTTLVAALVDLNTGEDLGTASALNPQSRHAQDVLSRIKIAAEGGLEELRSGVVSEINELIGAVASRSGVALELIYEVIYSGNTCMLHLAAGVDPAPLGRYPYTPSLECGSWIDAAAHGVSIAPGGVIYLPPIISAYVGADITAGLQAVRLQDAVDTVLFVDIGTNGEMALVHGGKLWATSTAAGPAFEGMNIRFGMRAGEGAIERFALVDGVVEVQTIGATQAVGICGSGLMDVVAELVAYGVIGTNGKFVKPDAPGVPPALAERLVEREGKTVFLLTDAVWLTQKDVRQVQLAKGAIRAGIEFLLREAGVAASALDRVLIAGSFGFHLTAHSLTTIGLLPPEADGRIDFVGNTAKSGGEAFLLNRHTRSEMVQLVKEIDVLELAQYRDFDAVFVAALSF
ncbi:ASKHA domain-containing protein [Geomesophilobacter sediminis]|uniref:DUF4445 domain-containing protein n=1 Tax=Geomesophilobacter sediminis TaxID=2798584 RepID=A0A8J7M3H2_9BACT|nr:ASKHA domain-containing protein [Geomesophilobacter sediminis]MBJ6727982.1 DUF4445 domain-containing protein [Geomesophilobacter sediminis]